MKKNRFTGLISLVILLAVSASGVCSPEDKIVSVTIANWLNNKNTALSITFDDGTHDQILYGIPLLRRFNLNATFYLPTSQIHNWDIWRKAFQSGDEIGSHTTHHMNLKQIPSDEILDELRTSYSDLTREIPAQVCISIAYPFGGVDQNIISKAKEYYVAGRLAKNTTNSMNNFSDIDFYQLKACGLSHATTLNDLDQKMQELAQNNAWLIEVIHGINNPLHPQKTGWKPVDINILKKHFNKIMNSKDTIWIAPVNSVASYMREKKSASLKLTRINENNYELRVNSNNTLHNCFSPITIKLVVSSKTSLQSLIHKNHHLAYHCKGNTCIFNLYPDAYPALIHLK